MAKQRRIRRYKGEGLYKWKGKAVDSHNCEFPYICYENRFWSGGKMVKDKLCICPWHPNHKFDSLRSLKAFMSSLP